MLLRALAPVEGLEEMFAARPAARRERDLCSGPAKLCQALGLDGTFDGADLVTGARGVTVRRRRHPAAAGPGPDDPDRPHRRRRAPVALVRPRRPERLGPGATTPLTDRLSSLTADIRGERRQTGSRRAVRRPSPRPPAPDRGRRAGGCPRRDRRSPPRRAVPRGPPGHHAGLPRRPSRRPRPALRRRPPHRVGDGRRSRLPPLPPHAARQAGPLVPARRPRRRRRRPGRGRLAGGHRGDGRAGAVRRDPGRRPRRPPRRPAPRPPRPPRRPLPRPGAARAPGRPATTSPSTCAGPPTTSCRASTWTTASCASPGPPSRSSTGWPPLAESPRRQSHEVVHAPAERRVRLLRHLDGDALRGVRARRDDQLALISERLQAP